MVHGRGESDSDDLQGGREGVNLVGSIVLIVGLVFCAIAANAIFPALYSALSNIWQ